MPFTVVDRCRNRPGLVFFALGVVENPRLVVGIVILSVILQRYKYFRFGFGGHIAISGCRSLSLSLGDTLFRFAMVENLGLAVGISTLSVVGPVV